MSENFNKLDSLLLERRESFNKIKELKKIIQRPNQTVDYEEKFLMGQQLAIMESYKNILEQRIANLVSKDP